MDNVASGLVPSDLEGFAGAPFTQPAIDAAVASIRNECGWHIAPLHVETREFATEGADALFLRSLRVKEVRAVSHVPYFGESVVTPLAYHFRQDAGVLWRFGGWPYFVSVTYQHGYEEWPADLLAVIADRARALAVGGKVRQESLLGRSVSLDFAAFGSASDPTLAAYRIGWP